jgi:hypothetical protein
MHYTVAPTGEREPLVQDSKLKTEEARKFHDEQNELLRRAAGLPPSKPPSQAPEPGNPPVANAPPAPGISPK